MAFTYLGTAGVGGSNSAPPPQYVLRADPSRDSVEVHFVNGGSCTITNAQIESAIGDYYLTIPIYTHIPIYTQTGDYHNLSIPIAELKAAMASGLNSSVPEIKPKPPKKLKPAEEAQRLWDQL